MLKPKVFCQVLQKHAYCLVCKKNTENINSKMPKTKIGRPYLSSKYTVCGNKKSKFLKRQEAKGFQFRYKNTIK